MRLPFTLSGLARAIECPAHLVIPHTQSVSPFASKGKLVHEFLERSRTMGRDAALDFIADLDDRAALGALDLENPALAMDAGAYAAEVAFAYNVRTGEARELGRGMGRDYSSATEDEVCGTADLVGLTENEVVILDYKTGWADLGPLWQNWQLRGYALAAARTYGKRRAVVYIIWVRNGEAHVSRPEMLSELDLELAATEVEALVGKVEHVRRLREASGIRELPTSQGPWCTYCPALDRCPSKSALVRAAVHEPAALFDFDTPLSEADWAGGVRTAEALRQLAERIEAAVKKRATARPIELGDGAYYATRKMSRRWVDGEKGRELLISTLGAEVLNHIESGISMESMRKLAVVAVRNRKDPSTGRRYSAERYVDEVFAKLEEVGAAGVTVTYTQGKTRKPVEGAPGAHDF